MIKLLKFLGMPFIILFSFKGLTKLIIWIIAGIAFILLLVLLVNYASEKKANTKNPETESTPPATNDTTFVGTTPCSPNISYKFDIHVTAPVYIKYTGASEAVYCEEGDDIKPPVGSKAGPVTITAATKKQAEIVVIRKN